MNRITRRGWIVIWILSIITLYAITAAMGIWDVSESCLVEEVGCPDGWLNP